MMISLRSSWALAKASWAVLRADRELLLFPFLAFLGLVAVFIVFLIPTVALASNHSFLGADGKSVNQKFDLVLTYDYENLSTPISETSLKLKQQLAAAGLRENDDKRLTLLVHRDPLLFLRWLDERVPG